MKCFVVFSLCVLVTVSNALTPCTDSSQCQTGECCQIIRENLIMSKRDMSHTGTCHRYTLEGGACGVFDRSNGYCSCAPGLRCQGKQVPNSSGGTGSGTTSQVQSRKLLAPQPGYHWSYQCVRE